MKIREFNSTDLAALLVIQDQNPTAGRWTKDDYTRLAGDAQGLILVAENEATAPPSVAGFAAYRSVEEEGELLNLVVAVEHQRQGVASALVREGAQRLIKRGARRIFLEVRESNQPALEFYSRAAFVQRGRRPDYYQDPCEDALILVKELTARG